MPDSTAEQRFELWKRSLIDHELRLTQARMAVMEILAQGNVPLSAQEIHDRARDKGYSLGIASVYRTLDLLYELDLIQHIHQPQGCEAYGPTPVGHKHFLICTECDRMVAFPGREELDDFFHEAARQRGYQVQDHWLQLFGLCQKCQNI